MCDFCKASCVVGQSGHLGGHCPSLPMPRSGPVWKAKLGLVQARAMRGGLSADLVLGTVGSSVAHRRGCCPSKRKQQLTDHTRAAGAHSTA